MFLGPHEIEVLARLLNVAVIVYGLVMILGGLVR